MRHLLLSIVALLVINLSLSSQVFVPTANPGAGSNNGYPWSTHPEWRFQMLIPASALGGMPFRITEMAFAPSGSTTFSSPQCEIRMAHTTQSTFHPTFDNNLALNRTVVYTQGPITWKTTAHQWCDVGLTSFFDYNGKDNLVVEIRYTARQGGTSIHTDGTTIQRFYVFGAGAYSATQGVSQIDPWAPNLRFTVAQAVLVGSGSPRPGNTILLDLTSPADAGLPFQLATSLGTGPIVLGSRQIDLSPDDLLVVTIFGYLPSIFVNYAGLLDPSGKAQAKINLVAAPGLVGVRLHSAFVTLQASAPFGIQSISNTFSFTVLP